MFFLLLSCKVTSYDDDFAFLSVLSFLTLFYLKMAVTVGDGILGWWVEVYKILATNENKLDRQRLCSDILFRRQRLNLNR